MIRWWLIAFTFASFIPGLARAQNDDSNGSWPVDYGAGYRMAMAGQHQEHAPEAGDDSDGQGPVKLDLGYPVITGPLTSDAKAYNAMISKLMPRWWKDVGGPKDNSPVSDPNRDVNLDCEPVGLPPPVDNRTPAGAQMLPGIISMACGSYQYFLGAAHGGGFYWGFNWLVPQHRPIKPDDIFIPNSGWLKALTALADADRGENLSSLVKLDFADRHHWVIRSDGLGLMYSFSEFSGAEDGGSGELGVIPWSKLVPYLRKDGIVPQSDWYATQGSN